MKGKTLAIWTLAVVVPYSAAFGYWWLRTRSPTAPKPVFSAKESEALDALEETFSDRAEAADRDRANISAEVARISADVKQIPEQSFGFGDATGKLLSSAQLELADQRHLSDVQTQLVGELKLIRLVISGLKEAISRRAISETITKLEEFGPRMDELIAEAELAIAKTKNGLDMDTGRLPEPARYKLMNLKTANLQQATSLFGQKKAHEDIMMGAKSLKRLVRPTSVKYDVARFPF